MSKIYHYTKLSTTIEHILDSMTLRTNYLNSLNDPKENQLWAFGGINIDYENIYPETYSEKTHISHQYKLGEEIKSKIQALCFVNSEHSGGYENEMMWAHYGERHKGLCVELDFDEFKLENISSGIFKFENVEYENIEKPQLYWNKNLSKAENIKNLIQTHYKSLFLSKSEYWEKEYEKRLLIISDEQHYLKINKSLTAIYFGLLTHPNYYQAIKRLINPNRTKLYRLYYERNKIRRMEI